MIVPDEIRKCVAFIGARKADGTYQLLGSGFFVGKTNPENATFATRVFFVTARHVIDGISSKLLLDDVHLRLNMKDGMTTWLSTKIADWKFHPNDRSVDVAIIEQGIPQNLDHLCLPQQFGATRETLTQAGITLGDEVFIVGLFTHHHGAKRNIPIVRVGNIACLLEEKIVTTKAFGEIDGYLIEARSIGGLSGSPVFVNPGAIRPRGNTMTVGGSSQIQLLGLIHGHFDSKTTDFEDAENGAAKESTERVNTGIAIVVPYGKIDEILKANGF